MTDTVLSEYHPFRSAQARDRYLSFYDSQFESWPVASEKRTVRTTDGDTFVRVSGPEDAPALVLLPASRANSVCWISMIEHLSRSHRTYAVDAIYDVGRSVNHKPMKTTGDACLWLDNLLDALGIDGHVDLMGLSLGGCTAAEYVLHSPDRLRKAVWLAPAGVAQRISNGFIFRSLPCMVTPRAFDGFMRWIMSDAADSEGRSRELFEAAVADVILSAKCYTMRPMPGGAPRALQDDELRGIEVPVLYVVGEHERVCPNPHDALARLKEVAPQIETHMIASCGHDLFWMEPRAVSERVLEFLET